MDGVSQPGLVLSRPHVLSARDQTIQTLTRSRNLYDLLEELQWPVGELSDYVVVQLNGEPIHSSQYKTIEVNPTDFLVVALVPRGGGGGGDNKKAILSTVASIALAIFAPMAGAAVGKAFELGKLATAAVTAGIGVVGALAIGALFGPRVKDSDAETVQRGYTISGQSNEATPYGAVLRVYGRHKVFPRVAAQIYNSSNGVENYATAILDFGYGPIQIEDLRLGDTPASSVGSFRSVIHESVQGDTPELQYYRGDVDQQPQNVELRSPQAHIFTTSAGTDSVEMDISFPEGLYVQDTKRGYLSTEDNAWVSLSISIRETGGAWQPWGNIAQLSMTPAYYAGHRSNAQLITFSGYQRRGFTSTIGFRMPKKGQWDIQVQKTTANWDTDNDSKTWFPRGAAYFTNLRSLFPGVRPVRPRASHTMIEIFVRASEQVSGALQQISAIATSRLRVWDGASFSVQPTRNPAWIFADILTGSANPRPVPDDRIDWEGLRAWAALCDTIRDGEPLYCYDAIHDSPATVWDQLQTVATAGRASPSIRDGKYTVIIDAAQSTPVQLFTPLNTWGFSANKTFLDLPHALKVQFMDPSMNWVVGERFVYDDGYSESNATKFEDLPLRGVTRPSQAWRDGRHWFASAKLRREEVSFSCDVENLVAQRGDLVLVQSDVAIVGGVAARISSVLGNGEFEVDAPLGVLVGALGVRVRYASGALSAVLPTTQLSETRFHTSSSLGLSVGDLVVIGKQSAVTGEYLIKEVTPGPDLTAEIVCVEVASAIYSADQGTIPPYVPQGGGVDQGVGSAIINGRGVWEVYYVDRYPLADATLSWQLPQNIIPALKYNIYELSKDGEWISIGQTADQSYKPIVSVDLIGSDYVNGQQLKYGVEPVWSTLTGPITPITVVVERPAGAQPTPAPLGLTAQWVPSGISAQWTDPKDELILSYNLRLINSQGVAIQAAQTSVHAYLFPDVLAGDYTVEVVAVDWRGTPSTPATVPVNVPAVPAVSFIGYFLDKTGIRVRWAALEWPEIRDYILREPGGAPDRVINGTSITLNPRVSGSYPISVVGRDRLGQESIAPATTTMIVPPVAPPTFVEGKWTQNGIVFTWVASTALWLEGYVIEEDGKEPITTGSTNVVMELRKAGTYTFRVRAVNSVGEKSVPVEVTVVVPEVPAVQDALATVRPDGIELTWKNVEGFNVVGYVIRRTSVVALNGAAPIYEYLGPIFIQSNKYLLPPHLAGEYEYSIHAVDSLNQESRGPALVSFVILLPKSTRISGNSVSNTAFLRWGSLSGAEGWSAQTSHMIEFYELTRLRLSSDTSRWQMLGFRSAQQLERMQTAQARYSLNPMVVRSSGLVEKFAVEFAYIDETEPGRWRYCIRAVDVAGNRGPFECMELMLNSPDNYELLDYLDNWLPVSDMHHCVPFDGDWLAPVNPNQSYEDHFIDNGNESPQDQIDKGWPIFIQPGDSPATARWEHDFGIDMPPIMVSIGTKFLTLAESLSIVSRIYYRAENETEWTLGAEDMKLDIVSMMRDKTRYIALEIELSQDAQRFGLAQLQSAYYRLDVKYMTDQGIVDVDAAGTHVEFTKYFLDVRSVQLSVQNVGDVFFSRYTVDQDQKGMTIYCFDSIGNPTTGRVSWLVRGV